jgi:hypothetical protein
MNAQYGPCEVRIIGGLQAEDETLPKAKITFLGESPNAIVRLYQFIPASETSAVGRFRCIDTIGAATVSDQGDDGFTVTGVSQQLVEEVGLSDADATVIWEVKIKGCETC